MNNSIGDVLLDSPTYHAGERVIAMIMARQTPLLKRMAEIVPVTMAGHAARMRSLVLAMPELADDMGARYGDVLDAVLSDLIEAG